MRPLMGIALGFFCLAVAMFISTIFNQYRMLVRPKPAPQLLLDTYWGPRNMTHNEASNAVKPFDITVKAELIDDLKKQLSRPLQLHEPLEGVGFEYGFNTKYLKEVVNYWRNTYLMKWNERENFLKKFPHFQTQIQGLKIHFIHVKPKKTGGKIVMPVLLLHGWPGSVRELYDIIPLLTTPNPRTKYVFEVIAPSLPGYGWSQAASKIGFGSAQMSVVLRNLMLRVGHEKFLIQGNDWSSMVGSNLATLFPENVLGYHSNMCFSNSRIASLKLLLVRYFPGIFVKMEVREFYEPIIEFFVHLLEETGHLHIQATKPDTIGTALTQNPVGLAAYILEKFSTWTNVNFRRYADGGLTNGYSLDALLDNVMIYYVTNSITTSMRLFAEDYSIAQINMQLNSIPVIVPSACARFKNDIMHSTDFQLKEKYTRLIQSTHHKKGGHFAAFEIPHTLYRDFVEFVHKIRQGTS